MSAVGVAALTSVAVNTKLLTFVESIFLY